MRAKNARNVDRWLGSRIDTKCKAIRWVDLFPDTQYLPLATEYSLANIYSSVRDPVLHDKNNVLRTWDKSLDFPTLDNSKQFTRTKGGTR